MAAPRDDAAPRDTSAPLDSAASQDSVAPRDDAAPRDDTARRLARGVGRLLGHLGYQNLTEFTLRSGRRADLAGIDRKGRIVIVEIKSSVADFRADQKWPEYLDYCDFFYFATPLDFPVDILPETTGLILADAYDGDIARPAPANPSPLHAGRRREFTLRFARTAAKRLRRWEDQGPERLSPEV